MRYKKSIMVNFIKISILWAKNHRFNRAKPFKWNSFNLQMPSQHFWRILHPPGLYQMYTTLTNPISYPLLKQPIYIMGTESPSLPPDCLEHLQWPHWHTSIHKSRLYPRKNLIGIHSPFPTLTNLFRSTKNSGISQVAALQLSVFIGWPQALYGISTKPFNLQNGSN